MISKAIIVCAAVFLICTPGSQAVTGFSIDQVDGAIDTGSLAVNTPITFHIRMTNSGANITGVTNAFRIYSPTGVIWDTTSAVLTGAIAPSMMEQFFINEFSTDGAVSDTVGFGGFSLFAPGIPMGFDTIPYTLTIGPIAPVYHGGQICIDSSYYRPAGVWKWSTTGGPVNPSWDGPHCYTIIDTTVVAASGSLGLDHISGLAGPDTLATGVPITFHIRMTNQTGNAITGLTNGFRVYSPTGSQWSTTSADTTGAISATMMENFFINEFSADGMGADTVGFGGFRLFAPGIPDGFDTVAYQVKIGPIDPAYGGGRLCIDTSYYPPAGIWKWSTTAGDHFPSWDGVHCFEIEGTPAVPRIVTVNPDTASRGQSLWVSITGENTKFGMGSGTTVRLTDQFGLSEIWAGSISVLSNTFMNVHFAINDSATLGPYSLTVLEGGLDSVSLSPAFWVTTGPQLVSISPDSGQQGDALTVTIVGQNTRFQQASWTVLRRSFETIYPNSFTALNDTIITAFYNIPSYATVGQWDVVVNQGRQVILPGGFTILPVGQPQIVSVVPDTAHQGQTLDVQITGRDTRFLQASMVTVRLTDSMSVPIFASSVAVIHNELLTARFSIPNSASPGYRDVTVNQGIYGQVTKYGAFHILPLMGADITLDEVDGLVSPGVLAVNQPIRFYMRLRNNTGKNIQGSTNGFKLYSNNGASWDSTSGQWTGAVTSGMYDQIFVNPFSADGMLADTIGFGGFRIFTTGIPNGFDDTAWTIDIGPIPASEIGKRICLDSAFYPPASVWLWSLGPAKTNYIPTWGGPYCFDIDSLSGNAPQITVSPDSFFVSQVPDDSTLRTLTIANSGGGNLDYQLEIIFAQPIAASGNTRLEVAQGIVDAQREAQVMTGADNPLTVWEENKVDEAVYQRLHNAGIASDAATSQVLSASINGPLSKTNTMIEDFEGGMPWPWAPWVITGGVSGGTTAGCAHDSLSGAVDLSPGWSYRTDISVGMPGCRLSLWVRPDSSGSRSYMGFGATSAGAWSLVAAPNTVQLIIQQNSNYNYLNIASVSQAYVPGSWYKLEVVFGDSGFVTGNLYAADGTTLLNSISTMISGLPQAGVALRNFHSCMDTFESINGMPSGWLRADRHSGSVPGGSADAIMLTFDAASLNPGEYLAMIKINSNDPANQTVMSFARMLVTGGGMTDLSLIHVDGLTMAGKLPYGQPITFHIGLNNTTGENVVGSTNGFRVYSPTGARWTTTTGTPTGAIDSSMYDQGVFVSPFSIDGMGADTIGFGGFRMFGSGIPSGFNEDVWTINIGPIPQSYAGGTICLDSAFYRPAGPWLWSLGPAKTGYMPTWDGPHCYQIEDSSLTCSLSVTPAQLSFTTIAGGPNPPCKSIFINSPCVTAMNYDTTWISVVPGELRQNSLCGCDRLAARTLP